ncbi:hypothetical protein ABPG75_012085 [Micractinium tetrahymenae]
MALDLLVLGAGLALLLLLIATLLFGQNPLLARTPLPRLHRLLTQAAPSAAAAAARRLGGRRASSALAVASQLCCERSNPSVQVLFLVLLVGCYTLYFRTVFPMLPLPGLPAWHKYTGTASALLCLAFFLAAGFADPGTITPATAAAHAALYPPDGLWYPEKDCRTCGLPRPARSKHCRVCGRCIARIDHHCIWINRCVGLMNMRYFLGFLLSTTAVCLYGLILGAQAIWRDMALQGTWHTAFQLPDSGRLVYLSDSRRFTLRYIIAVYGPQAAATFFVGCCAFILLGFTSFQLTLLLSGLTTVELHRRKEVQLELGEAAARQAEEEEAAWLMARVDAALAGSRAACTPTDGPGSADARDTASSASATVGGQAPPCGGQRRQVKQRLAPPFDRGAWRNLSEVLFPHYHLRQAAAAAAREGGGGKKWA